LRIFQLFFELTLNFLPENLIYPSYSKEAPTSLVPHLLPSSHFPPQFSQNQSQGEFKAKDNNCG
jgi:hypothetical protein